MSRGFGTGGMRRPPWRWGELAPAADPRRDLPGADPGERRWNRMGTWNKMNRSKRSLCLDAKPAEGAAVLEALIAAADLVVHNLRRVAPARSASPPSGWPSATRASRRLR